MSERKPNDVIEKSATVTHRCVSENGTQDDKWHCGVMTEELWRARASEDGKAQRILALESALETEHDMLRLLYHSIRAGHQGASLKAAMETVEHWLEERKP